MLIKNMTPFLWVIVGVVVVLVLWIIGLFNSLIVKRNRVKNAFSDVDVQLKRRYDLVPNLVETVKGYASHEQSVFENVTRARSAAMNATGNENRAAAENQLTGAIKSLFAVAENYPQLRVSENFQQLQTQLSDLENDIQSARRYYNASVREFNNAVQVFPSNIFAGILGFKQSEFFGADETERQNVKVAF